MKDKVGFVKAFFQLCRIEHAFFLVLAVLIAEGLLFGKILPINLHHLVILFVPSLVEIGAFVLNDYFDVASDRINRRFDRPLVRGDLPEEVALFAGFLSFSSALILASWINEETFGLVFLFTIFSLLYDIKLKDFPLIGNIFIALSMAIPFIYTPLAFSQPIPLSLYLVSFMAFLFGLAREIIKDIEDIRGDVEGRQAFTLPVIWGVSNAAKLSVFLILLFLPLSFLFFYLVGASLFLWIILMGIYVYLVILLRDFLRSPRKEARRVRKDLLKVMGLGLILMLVAVLMGGRGVAW